MKDIAIRVENLGKRYTIGVGQRHDTLRDALADFRLRIADFGRKSPKSRIENPKSGEFWALKDVSFEVHRGEVVGIIGRNGAGKSTLLKILSRITEPTTGYAEIHGRVGSLLEVGTGFHPELTGRENIYLNGAILGMKRTEIDRKFDEIVAFSEIEKFLDTPVKRYSSGMYVRLAFAVAAHLEPEILLVDEVLAVGDAAFQKKCLGKMGDIAGEGRTVLFVSHNMAAIHSFCPRTICLLQGKLYADGDSADVIEKYLVSMAGTTAAKATGHFVYTNHHVGEANIIKELKLCNSSGEVTTAFRMGQPMTLEIALDNMSASPSDECTVVIFRATGEKVCTMNTRMNTEFVSAERGRREIATLTIPKLPLTSGDYWIDLGVYRLVHGYIQYITRAGQFHVHEDDVYGSGYVVRADQGYFYLDAVWRVENAVSQGG